MMEPRDLFGRTEAELVVAIQRAERIYEMAYTGGSESAALEHARKYANLSVDRRQLALLRGERVEYREPLRHLTDAQLEDWRRDVVKRGRAGAK